ncbi:hypothetical protein [Rhodopirellula europaea]|uniref:hypothetical protein n=1 Tax=Rhodopirellula europaea TaxID=1263866 RepID=UPI003D28A0F8|tara:strand:- start:42313 stop:42882 length:570 start_codon:yes stop_codon:yes gene_type:complete
MERSAQRFSIFDLLSLLAAFAIAFAMVAFNRRQWDAFSSSHSALSIFVMNWYAVGTTLCIGTFYLGSMMARRRPTRAAIVGSPGRAAILAICLASAVAKLAAWESFSMSVFPLTATLIHLPFSIGGSPLVAAAAGLTAWGTVSLGTQTKCRPDWLDQSGKACTLLWLLLSFTQPLTYPKVLTAIGYPLD